MKAALKVNPPPWSCRVCGHSLFNHRIDRRVGCIGNGRGCDCTLSARRHRTIVGQRQCFDLMARYYE